MASGLERGTGCRRASGGQRQLWTRDLATRQCIWRWRRAASPDPGGGRGRSCAGARRDRAAPRARSRPHPPAGSSTPCGLWPTASSSWMPPSPPASGAVTAAVATARRRRPPGDAPSCRDRCCQVIPVMVVLLAGRHLLDDLHASVEARGCPAAIPVVLRVALVDMPPRASGRPAWRQAGWGRRCCGWLICSCRPGRVARPPRRPPSPSPTPSPPSPVRRRARTPGGRAYRGDDGRVPASRGRLLPALRDHPFPSRVRNKGAW